MRIRRPPSPAWCSIVLLAISVCVGPRAARAAARPADVERCEPVAGVPSDAELEAAGARVGEIRYRLGDIFDPSIPGEDRRLFRLANKLHPVTRPRTVAEQLTFRTGDLFARRVLDESERLLRTNRYFYDVAICPVAYDGKAVAVEVRTRDVWTLRAGVNFGRAGGANKSKVQVIEDNVLGSGKSLAFERASTVDRTTALVRATDPHVGGSRVYASAEYSRNSDGRALAAAVERPFYVLDARWATGASWRDDRREDSLWDLGHIQRRFEHHERSAEVYGGLSPGLVDGWTRRTTFGFTVDEHAFTRRAAGDPPAPDGRQIDYPWVGFEILEDDYARTSNFNQMHRVEDLALGLRAWGRAGIALPGLGADRRAGVLSGGISRGLALPDRQTLLFDASLRGRYDSPGGVRGLLVVGDAKYYRRDFGDQLLLVHGRVAYAHALDPEDQLLLGGDTGLRGYPLRYQSGDYLCLLQIEQRWFWNWYPYRLLRVGAAGFFDVGRAWTPGDARVGKERGWLADAGVGLRFSLSRSGLGNVIHVDFALPLVRGRDVHSVEIVVTTQATF